MTEEGTRETVLKQLAALRRMSPEELREKWTSLYHLPPPNQQRAFLVKRLAYRIQEIYYGGLTEKDYRKIDEINKLLNKEKKNPSKASEIKAGTRFFREWNGSEYEVVACEKGFEYNGRLFSSLSAVAREITGTRWNGLIFFGLKDRRNKK